jgi:aminoglycoside phosphotransferase (APT) family kinase protein
VIFDFPAQEWLRRHIDTGAGELEIAPLSGATSSSVYAVKSANRQRKFVLRVIDNPNWLQEEPDVAAHEAAALEQARRLNLRAPRLVAYSSEDVGFGAPVVLMTFLEGKIDLLPGDRASWLNALACELAVIHRHRVPDFPWSFRTWANLEALAPPQWSAVPDLWKRAIDIVRELAARPLNESDCVFVHRDFHATNVLWDAGRISGVVDWISACRGPAAVDVAHCRTDLALMRGPPAAEQFLRSYLQAAAGYEHDWRYDLDSILDMCSPQPTYYEPWQAFGLERIPQPALQQRIDAHLRSVMAQR